MERRARTYSLYDGIDAAGKFDRADDERLFMWTKEYRGPVVNDKYSLYKLAGIDPEATFHTLRAANATNRDAAGQDFEALQDELGHAKGSTITRKQYIRPDDRQVIDASATYNEYLERLRSESILDAETVTMSKSHSIGHQAADGCDLRFTNCFGLFFCRPFRRTTNPLVVQNLFAHSDMSITNIYAETEAELMLEAVKRLDDVDHESNGHPQ